VKLKTLFLDAGGVLLYPNWVRVSECLGRWGVLVSAEALRKAEPAAKREFDAPVTFPPPHDDSRGRDLLNLVLTRAGVQLSEATAGAAAELREYHAKSNLWDVVPSEVPGALKAFRAAGLDLAVVSNSNGTLRQCLDRLGLAQSFSAVVDSTEIGVEKPDRRIFLRAMEQIGAKPETTLHLGDMYHIDVVGAEAAGLRAVLLDSADLYGDHPCRRVPSLLALGELIRSENA